MSKTRVVITGLGATTPVGGDVASTWEALLAGKSGAKLLTADWVEELPVKIAAPAAVEPTEVIERVKARRLDRNAQFAVVAAREAWADSGLADVEIDKTRLGVAIATGIGGLLTTLANYDALQKGPRRVSPLAIPMLMPNSAAANVGLELGALAGVQTPVSACASSNEAISLAADQIRLGRADIVVAGGAEGSIAGLPLAAFGQMMALSKRNDDPERASRPWDVDRDGFLLGEGAGVLVLENYEHAVARGAKIYAEFAGAGITADGHDIVQPDPTGSGAERAMRQALREGDLATGDIVHINAHATSTPVGDVAESRGDPQGAGQGRRQRGRHRAEVDDRAPARRGRCGRVDRHRARPAPPGGTADHQPGQARRRRRARHRDRAAQARRRGHRGAEQLLRLRRTQRRPRLQVGLSYRVSRAQRPGSPSGRRRSHC